MPFSYTKTSVITKLPTVIEKLGLDADEVLEKVGIQKNDFTSGNSIIPTTKILEIVKDVKAQSGCEHIGLLLGGELTEENIGAPVELSKTCPTFGDALREGFKYVHLNTQLLQRELHTDGKLSYMVSILNLPSDEIIPEAIQVAVAANWTITNMVADGLWHPRLVCFTFDTPSDKKAYTNFFQLPIQFGADFNGIAFDTDDLDIPLKGNNTNQHDMWLDYIHKLDDPANKDFISGIKLILRKQISNGKCSIDTISAYLPYERRTLQRKLEKYGTSYQQLLDEVRFEKAVELLKTSDMGIARIADILGYKNPSVFSKAFKKQCNLSPANWKKENLK
jgi:AraC-like DNA-binding protein